MNFFRGCNGTQSRHCSNFMHRNSIEACNLCKRNDVCFDIDVPFVIWQQVRTTCNPIKRFVVGKESRSQFASFLDRLWMMEIKRWHQHHWSPSICRCSFFSQALPARPSSASCSGTGSTADFQPCTWSSSGRSGSKPNNTPLTYAPVSSLR